MAKRDSIAKKTPDENLRSTSERIINRYKKYRNDPVRTVLAAHEGIPAYAFNDVTELFGYRERIAGLLNVSIKTMKRYQDQKKKLDASSSEMLLKLVAIFAKGVEVFGERSAFLRWLEKPAYGLGKNIPFNLMKTSDGIDLVMEELIRIEYGDLA